MNRRFRFLVTKHLLVATALGLLVLFLPALSQAQIPGSGESYAKTADPGNNYVAGTLVGYVAAIALAFTILVALACAGVLALTGIYISNQGKSRKPLQTYRRSLNLDQPPINPSCCSNKHVALTFPWQSAIFEHLHDETGPAPTNIRENAAAAAIRNRSRFRSACVIPYPAANQPGTVL